MEPLTIVLLGHTGVGKSASGNTILGREAFESRHSFRSVTTEISSQEGDVGGWSVRVVDTPEIQGHEDTIRSLCEEQLLQSPFVLFLVVINTDRFTQEKQDALKAALDVVGEGGRDKTFLLFTGEDMLDKTVDEFINEDPDGPLPQQVSQFQNRYHIFNNKCGRPEQVQELLRKYKQYCSIHPREAASPNPSVQKKKSKPHKKQLRLVLLGLPGAGKSSSGNTILGQNLFKSGNDFDPLTTEAVVKKAEVDGRSVTVVDTPGISDEKLSPKKLFHEIMQSTQLAAPGPHAFIIVVRLGRTCKAHQEVFKMLAKMFDKNAPRFSMVLFTHADGQSDQDIQKKIQHEAIQELLSKCGGRYCVFNNLERHDRTQVHRLLDTVEKMVKENKGWYTPEQFRSVHSLWDDLQEWFIQILEMIKRLFVMMMMERIITCATWLC